MDLSTGALQPDILELEARRQRLHREQKRLKIAAAIGAAVCVVLACMALGELAVGFLIVGGITLVVFYTLFANRRKTFATAVKHKLVNGLLGQIGHGIQLFPERGIGADEFNKAQLFSSSSDRHKTEDLVKGQYHHTPFYFAEVHAQYKDETRDSDGKKQTSYQTFFDGIVLVAEFNKKLKGRTIVRPKLGGMLGNLFGNFFHSFRGKVIHLENQVFMERFVTYGNEEIEAHYVLTPLLMERILQVEDKFGKRINLSFAKNSVYVAIPFKENFFEASLNTELGIAQFEDEVELVKSMLDVIEALDLNTRIWEK